MAAKTISILGCGWLGFPLARELAQQGWIVNGSTTNKDKFEQLQKNHITPYLIDLNKQETNNVATFFQAEYLLINLPPSKLNDAFLQYAKLKNYIDNGNCNKLIFISSTSAYGKMDGIATEEMTENINNELNSTLKLEQTVISLNKKTTIIRFAGLIGPGRHPGRFFSPERKINNPNFPVNLIHLDDCIGIIITILQKEEWNQIFNACADNHPTKKEFYTKACLKLNGKIPEFVDIITNESGKIISNDKIKKQLDYQFKHPNLLELLDQDHF
nr:hypothetical protein [uncultured Carboxylicivirga sp.]